MARSALRYFWITLVLLALGCTPSATPVGQSSSELRTRAIDTQPVRANPEVEAPIADDTDGEANLGINTGAVGLSPLADGSGGAPAPPPPELITREAYLAMVEKNDKLRADIRDTNPKLQLIIDGKFDEFAKLLDEEPRLATLRFGYYADKPDPLNPMNAPPRGGPSALELAAKHGSLELVKRLATPQVLADESMGKAALENAANVEIAAALIDAGVKIPPVDLGNLESPYRIAAEHGNLALCQWFKDQKTEAQIDVEVVNGQYWRPIGFACENGHLEVVKWFAAQGVPLTLIPGTLTDKSGWGIYSVGSSPLARAAAGGQVEVMKYLLENGAREDLSAEVQLRDSAGAPAGKISYSPPLCNAAANGHVEAVELLLEAGAQVTSRLGLSPLHQAALNGHADIFNLLLDHGAKITTDKYVTRVEETAGIDLFCCAVRGGNVAIFERVIDNWPRAWLTDDSCSDMYHYYQGRGPLAVAVSADHVELVQRMIDISKAAAADDRKTALNHALTAAVETDNGAIVKLLHAAGAPLDEPLLAPSPGGENASQSPIARAAAHGSCDVLRYLIDQKIDVETRDDHGRTLLHFVCRKDFAPQPKLFADKPFRIQVIGCLLDLGASPNATDKAGRSILHDAVYHLEPEEVSLLIDHRASPMVHDADGETPVAQFERLLAGKYKDKSESRPWNEWHDQPPKRTASSWRERIRVEENLKMLQ